MKTFFGILLLCFSLTAFSQKSYLQQWQTIDSLTNLGQAQSALDRVKDIYEQSRRLNQAEQFVKASLYRIKLEADFEEDFFENAIIRTRADIASAKAPVEQILHSILAELYWNYYQANRWKILGRSETVNLESDDIKTWDLKKLVSACMENYTQSLSAKDLLKNTNLSAFGEILEKQEGSERYRPTLFDFLAHRAIDFYTSNEAGLTRPAQTFFIDKPGYFKPSDEFASLQISSPDPFSFEYQAIKLYQEVVGFHLLDTNPAALVDAETERLSFVHTHSTLPLKDSLYLAALQALELRYIQDSVSTRVAYEIALQLSNGNGIDMPFFDNNAPEKQVAAAHVWDLKKAIAVCEAAIRRFPESFGAKNCRTLAESIKLPSQSLTADYASIPCKPSLALVKYKNLSKLYLRLLKMDPEADREIGELPRDEQLQKYLGIKAVKAWEQALPEAGDYRQHAAEIRIPSLPQGYYVLLAATDTAFPATSAIVSATHFWKTNISYLSRTSTQGNNEVWVVHRETGQPMTGVKVQVFKREYDARTRKNILKSGGTFVSGKNGLVSIPISNTGRRYSQYNLVFSKNKDKLIPENYFLSYVAEPVAPQAIVQTHFFTDRAIYRPGQTIYFKGIVLERNEDSVKLKTAFKTEVSLMDANGQLIAKQLLTTSDFGSFSGSFTAPQGLLNGLMTIRCESGSVSVQVEEYKRPKFEVAFEPLKGAYKLGETITAKGTATAYAGSSVADAKVTYRVVRQVHFPYWWWGWRNMPATDQVAIANGVTITSADGSFTVPFEAIPDPTVDPATAPMFTYTVNADVSDINGETHSSSTAISAGYKALLLNADVADEVNLSQPFRFSLSATNLNGEKQVSSGSISISKLSKPGQVYFTRKWERPDQFTMTKADFEKDFPGEAYKDEDDISTWPAEKSVFSSGFNTQTDSVFTPSNALSPGMYLLEIKSRDAFGQEVEYRKYFSAFQPNTTATEAVSPAFFSLLTPAAEPGTMARFVLGSPLKKVSVLYEVIQKDKVLSREIIRLNQSQKLISIPVNEELRGNFGINISFVKHNRTFQVSKIVNVPYTNKKLDIRFASFRSKLQPGQEEEWQLTLRDSKGNKAVAEMFATMYDASLDAIVPQSWAFDIYNTYFGTKPWNDNGNFNTVNADIIHVPAFELYPETQQYDALNWFGFNYGYPGGRMMKSMAFAAPLIKEEMEVFNQDDLTGSVLNDKKENDSSINMVPGTLQTQGEGNLLQNGKPIQLRKDFNETAFFYPQLATNADGEIVIRFKAPEALTRWKMMGLAYTRDLQYGQVEKTLVTQKDLMLFTNAPRFLREGDKMAFSAKISNISNRELAGTAAIHFFDAFTMQPLDDKLGIGTTGIPFDVKQDLSTPVSWHITVPEGLQAVVYQITATAGNFSDGEEAAIPVLTNRMLVTESMPLPVNGNEQKNFSFQKLLNSGKSSATLRNYRLTLEYTSNPAWYAVQALPYLMEYPYECSEQLFSRYYANSLATFIANSDPRIKSVFESWKTISPDALKSNLEKNEELKSVLLQESPWVREASNESERKQRLAMLFDLNRMASEQTLALKKLADRQYANGGWPWFEGMPESRYITQYVVSGIGHLYHLKVVNLPDDKGLQLMAQKAIAYLDQEINTSFEKIKKLDKNYQANNHLGYEDIQYLYARTFFNTLIPIPSGVQAAVDYFKKQSTTYWNMQDNYMKAMMALYLNRFGDRNTAALIMRSLSETALHSDEMGMYWRNEPRGWNWYQAPVETQAMLIEAFDEVSNDQKSVDELKTWLLKQKQTQDWKTTKATSEAVYALLLRGTSLLASDKQVEVTLGNEKVDPYRADGVKPEAGTGYFKTSWTGLEIKPEMGNIKVSNPNPTVAWGALYWQYFEQLDKITPAQTPLSISKKLFREVNTATGPVIEPVTDTTVLKTGDKIVVRIELRADRDMEYIHLKDMRATAFEPVNVLSGYRYQGGLGYYESTRDASSSFFISYLPKGTYVFEYKLTATQKGDFSNGVTSVQCMYAPEFSAHSEGIRVKVE